MKDLIRHITTSKAALIMGIAFISSLFIVTLVDDFLLANFVVPGDMVTLAEDIESNRRFFCFAVICYLFVLALDAIIGLALYVVLKSTNRNLALFTALLRLLYALTLTMGVLALAFQIIDVFDYESIKLFGYILFALHLLILGYTVFKSEYIPKGLGVLLLIASFTYIVFFVDFDLPETLGLIIMSTMALGELSLSIWLIVKRNSLPVKGGDKAIVHRP